MATVEELEKRVAALEAFVATLRTAIAGGKGTGAPIADDADLNSKYGDPTVRNDPKRWEGGSFKGRPFSQCPPDYLDALASFLEWRAGKEAEDPAKAKYEKYSRSDAARARGWARRIRSGWRPSPAPKGVGGDPMGDDEFRFGANEENPF